MRSGGEAEHADAIGIDVPLSGVRADKADGALRVLKSGGGFRIRAGVGDAIFEDDAGDAAGGEPVADFGAFEIHRENVIAAAGENDDCGAGGFGGRLVEGDSRRGDVAETDEGSAGDEIVFGCGGVGFGGRDLVALRPGASLGQMGICVWPEDGVHADGD